MICAFHIQKHIGVCIEYSLQKYIGIWFVAVVKLDAGVDGCSWFLLLLLLPTVYGSCLLLQISCWCSAYLVICCLLQLLVVLAASWCFLACWNCWCTYWKLGVHVYRPGWSAGMVLLERGDEGARAQAWSRESEGWKLISVGSFLRAYFFVFRKPIIANLLEE